MVIPPFTGQEAGGGFDIFWLFLPLLCCLMMTQGRGGDRPQAFETISEQWFTTQDIETAFKSTEERTAEWMQEAADTPEPSSITSKLRSILPGRRNEPRFTVNDSQPPKLHELNDRTGPIYFEFTEVEDGGTVVKATYNMSLKSQMAKLKASLPLKIPSTPISNNCPACGKPVLREFNMCPYCGENLIKE